MREYGSNIILPSLDNLCSSEQERQDAKLEKIQILPLSELHPFEGHPFQVRDDEEMDKMVLMMTLIYACLLGTIEFSCNNS